MQEWVLNTNNYHIYSLLFAISVYVKNNNKDFRHSLEVLDIFAENKDNYIYIYIIILIKVK